MSNFFDKSLHYLGKNDQNIFVMNIGAMDGVLFDEMIGYTKSYKFKGLYVEPIPYLFEKLKNNHPNDWLLCVEIVELLKDTDEKQLLEEVFVYLDQLKEKRPEVAHLIAGGLDLIFDKEAV